MEEPKHATHTTHHTTHNVAVVIPAAGSGLRMGGTAKQFRPLGDAPVLVQTLRAFAKVEEIRTTVVAVPESEVGAVGDLVIEFGLDAFVVAGGATRQESVGEGLRAVPEQAEIVLVHDAVRPFISAIQIRTVISAIESHGAAALAAPVADTLRRRTGSDFGETVERDGVYRMLTPQGARKVLLVDAHEKAAESRSVATDEVELLQRTGVVVHLVVGDERNIKLTRPSDWAIAEALWPEWTKEMV